MELKHYLYKISPLNHKRLDDHDETFRLILKQILWVVKNNDYDNHYLNNNNNINNNDNDNNYYVITNDTYDNDNNDYSENNNDYIDNDDNNIILNVIIFHVIWKTTEVVSN